MSKFGNRDDFILRSVIIAGATILWQVYEDRQPTNSQDWEGRILPNHAGVVCVGKNHVGVAYTW